MHRNHDEVPKHVTIAHFCDEVQYHGIETDHQELQLQPHQLSVH